MKFRFADVFLELESMLTLSKPYIDASSHFVLPQFRTGLQGIQSSRQVSARWEIPEEKPLVTRPSQGEYEPDSNGGLSVFAEISCIWEISCVPTKSSKTLPSEFELHGLASTKVRIKQVNEDGSTQCAAMWRMEIGDSSAPGCHFHVQVLGELQDGPFPKSLPVPRLPGLPATPLLVVEYVLAEMFQDEWQRSVVGQKRPELQMWRGIQSQRFKRFLEWQGEIVSSTSLGSPWTELKVKKPDADLFTKA